MITKAVGKRKLQCPGGMKCGEIHGSLDTKRMGTAEAARFVGLLSVFLKVNIKICTDSGTEVRAIC